MNEDRATVMALPLRILGRSIDLTMIIGAIAVALMMAHITADVISKYLFRSPLPGTITAVSNYYMIIVAFLPLAFTERRNGHISVEVVSELMPMAAQRALNIFGLAFSAAIFTMLAWQGWIEAGRDHRIATFAIEQNTRIAIWPARYLLPIGCTLMVITLLVKIGIALIRGERQHLSKPFF
jgi:TRAP-type C4-dicarboxylate transport system permease small subunit